MVEIETVTQREEPGKQTIGETQVVTGCLGDDCLLSSPAHCKLWEGRNTLCLHTDLFPADDTVPGSVSDGHSGP